MPVFTCTRRMLPQNICLRFRFFVVHAMDASCSRHVPFMYSLRFRNFSCYGSTICALHATHTRASRSRRLRRPVPFMYSRASCSFSRFMLARDDCAAIIARCARAMRTPIPITCADCPNECLYQFGSRSVQPFGRQRLICSVACTFA
jgi:hypothetical protein